MAIRWHLFVLAKSSILVRESLHRWAPPGFLWLCAWYRVLGLPADNYDGLYAGRLACIILTSLPGEKKVASFPSLQPAVRFESLPQFMLSYTELVGWVMRAGRNPLVIANCQTTPQKTLPQIPKKARITKDLPLGFSTLIFFFFLLILTTDLPLRKKSNIELKMIFYGV